MDDFDRFVAESLEPLLRTAVLITWDGAEAEDLVQECLTRVGPAVRRPVVPARCSLHLPAQRYLAAAGERHSIEQRLQLTPLDM